MGLNVICGTVTSLFSVLLVESLVIVPSPARSLASVGAVASPVIGPGSVCRSGIQLLLLLSILLQILFLEVDPVPAPMPIDPVVPDLNPPADDPAPNPASDLPVDV